MGLTVLTIEVANPADADRREPVDFLVDSGAVYSFVPRGMLERLGIASHSRQRFRLSDGSTIERDRGDALFFYKGHRGAAPVIFAEPSDATLLGAVTLESLGFVLDAIRRNLLPLPMVVGGASVSIRTFEPRTVEPSNLEHSNRLLPRSSNKSGSGWPSHGV